MGAFFFFLLKGKGLHFIKAKLSVLRNLNKLLKKRKIIQKTRKVDNAYLQKIMEKRCFTVRIRGKF